MRPHRRVFVVGGAHTPYLGKAHPDFISRRHPDFPRVRNPTLEEHLHRAIREALAVSGVEPGQVEKGYVSNFLGECFSRQGHLGAMAAAAHPDLEGRPFARIEAACASGAAAIAASMDAMQAGYDVLLVAGAEVETNVRGRDGVEYMARAAHYEKERGLSAYTFPHLFGRRSWAYKEKFGHTDEATGRVVVKAHRNAGKNPLALMQDHPVTLEIAASVNEHNHEFLEDDRYRERLRILDCTNFTDGASALVLATEAGLEKLGIPLDRCTEILSYGHSVRALGAETDPTQLSNVAAAAQRAYADADLRPGDVEVAEVHDCFSITELQMYEALGFCGPGEAPGLLADGVVDIEGRLPVNTGGGLLGFGHPIGATGVKQVVEIWRQMKGRCGDYQLARAPSVGITANLGGDDRTGIVMLHRAC